MSPIPEDASIETCPQYKIPSVTANETDLYDVSADIKSTLTDLLNCEAVRKDGKMRMWVQTRLMDAEMELKRQRKRKRSTPAIVLSPSDEIERKISM